MHLHQLAASQALKLPEVTVSQPFGEGCDVFDTLPDLKDGDSSCETLMSERKNV